MKIRIVIKVISIYIQLSADAIPYFVPVSVMDCIMLIIGLSYLTKESTKA